MSFFKVWNGLKKMFIQSLGPKNIIIEVFELFC